MDQGYKQIARKLGLPGWEDLSLNTFETVSEWLNEHGRWLLVFDNADDVDLFYGPAVIAGQQKQIHEYIPRCEDGTTIITTRDKRVAYRLTDREDPITVPPMNISDAGALLRSKTMTDQGHRDDLTRDSELLEILGNLPLAITQAAAFISENNITVAEYLDVFATNQSEAEGLLSEEMGDHRRYSESGNSIMSTLKLSFDQITKQKPLAADLLSFMAFLDRNGIPKSLLKRDNVRTVDFVSALGALQAFSLIGVEEGGASFEMHRLVQLAMQRWLRNSRVKWQNEVIKVLSERFPLGDYSNWKECETLSPHAQMAISYSDQSDSSAIQRSTILHNLAKFDGEQSRYELADKRYTEVIAIRERVLGPDHPDTLKSMSFLAEVLFREGKYARADSILRRVIDGSEKLFGAQSDETLFNIGLLAEVVQGEGKLAEAEELFRMALVGEGETLKDVHALRIADNLGAVLRDEEKFEESEMWIRKALVGRENLLSPTHLETLRSVNHLALLLSIVNRLDEAELVARRAVAGSEMAMGRNHHLTFMSLHTFGDILRLQRHYDAATEHCRRALDGLIKVLGRENRGTLRCFQTLALIEEDRGRLVEAEALLREIVEGNKKVLGERHLHTRYSVQDLERVKMARRMQEGSA